MPRKKKGPRSISSRQKELLDKFGLDDIGSGKNLFKGAGKLDPIEEALIVLAQVFADEAVKALNEHNAHDTGNLEGSIDFGEVQISGVIYSVEISVLDYYKFIDQGVKGVKSTPPGAQASPYKFKNLYVSKKFRNQLRKWIIRHGLKANARPVVKDNYRHALGKEKKAKPFSGDHSDAAAEGLGRAIKARGIKPTKFWERAEEALLQKLKEQAPDLAVNIFINELVKS